MRIPSIASDPSSEISRKINPGVRFDKPTDRRLIEENDSGIAAHSVAACERNWQMAGSSSTMKQIEGVAFGSKPEDIFTAALSPRPTNLCDSLDITFWSSYRVNRAAFGVSRSLIKGNYILIAVALQRRAAAMQRATWYSWRTCCRALRRTASADKDDMLRIMQTRLRRNIQSLTKNQKVACIPSESGRQQSITVDYVLN